LDTDGFFNNISEYFKEHQEQEFVLKSFLLIILIMWLRQYLLPFIGLIILIFPVVFLIYIRLQSISTGRSPYELLAEHITFIPVMYTAGERKKEGVTWVTYSIIFINILVFYIIEPTLGLEYLAKNLIFLPYEPNVWNVPVSAFTAIFLHAHPMHLWGNMIFLWAVGTVVERRIGAAKFLVLYLATGLVGELVFTAVYSVFLGTAAHGLGASGAISGVMGIFAVRCYFKTMVFPLPILGIFSLILPINLKVKLNSLVIIGLFFMADLSGGIGQITGTGFSNVGHWVHLGGMVSGIVFALCMGLEKGAVEERHLEIGIEASNTRIGIGKGEDSLRIALGQNPDNPEALLHLARIRSKSTLTDEGMDLYQKAVGILARTKPAEAAKVFKEYFGKYFKGVEPVVQMKLASVFHKDGDLDIASRCLEMLADSAETPPEIREKATYHCARILEEMGLDDAATRYYRLLLTTFPNSVVAPKVKAKLAGT
jgi:membrane associated rhomboid family serine protease